MEMLKKEIFGKVLQRRGEIGYPYIFFKDNVTTRHLRYIRKIIG